MWFDVYVKTGGMVSMRGANSAVYLAWQSLPKDHVVDPKETHFRCMHVSFRNAMHIIINVLSPTIAIFNPPRSHQP
jgi:hypothetical protein